MTDSLGRPDFLLMQARRAVPTVLLVWLSGCLSARPAAAAIHPTALFCAVRLLALCAPQNEFGLGKPGTYKGTWTRFQKSLALIEFNLELHVLWRIQSGVAATKIEWDRWLDHRYLECLGAHRWV